jgi:PAS domain S-box-containing protein
MTGPPSLDPLGRAERAEQPEPEASHPEDPTGTTGNTGNTGTTGNTGNTGPTLNPSDSLYAIGPEHVGSYGPARLRLPLFALVAIGTVIIGVLPFPPLDARREISLAGVLFFLLVAAAFLLPWEHLPDWAWLVIPIGYMAVIAIIRDAQGGSRSYLVAVYLLPIVWLAVYGRTSHLLAGLFCVDLALLVPVLLVGAPKYPTTEWREVLVMIAVSTLVASLVNTMVSRDRDYVADLAQQSRYARRSALVADNARDRLETLLRAATGTAIMGVDPSGTVTFFSAGAEQMLGYGAAEVVGIHSIADFIDPAQIDERRQTIDDMRSALTPVDDEAAAEVPWTATRKDGQQRRCVVRVRALPALDPAHVAAAVAEAEGRVDDESHGKPKGVSTAADAGNTGVADQFGTPEPTASSGGYVVVAIDVTEREELASERERLLTVQSEVTQSLIEQNNRLRELTQMKDDVVATVSHELRTPITSIRGFIELLMDGAAEDLSPDQLKMLRTIDRNTAQLQRVAEDLLADPGAGHGLRVAFSELDLHRLAEDAVEAMQMAGKTAGISVTLDPAADSPVPVFGDAGRLHQLIGNLLSNAIKFSPRGARVVVIADAVDRFARIQVLDEGPGIPENERDQLFERFYRLASSTAAGVPGTGLGLAIAKSVAEAHEGFVDIVDTPGWSTTFRVFLPLRTPAGTDGGPGQGAGAGAGAGAPSGNDIGPEAAVASAAAKAAQVAGARATSGRTV